MDFPLLPKDGVMLVQLYGRSKRIMGNGVFPEFWLASPGKKSSALKKDHAACHIRERGLVISAQPAKET
ncbi:hypothetical protein [Sphingopyxis sp.]|uniref:hypothetical protein n=1 Tax=Sphingopyxis sp. TaxID=1908224 RepID=UPI002ED9C038